MEMIMTVIRLAIRGLLAYKARSLLTMLGIIIGIGAVIVMISVGRGANASIQENINSLGSNMIMVFSGSSLKGGASGGYGSTPTLRIKDAEAMLRECPAISDVTHITSRTGQVVAGEKNWSTTVSGTTASYREVRDWTMEEGEFFSERHVRSGANVVILGRSVVKNLFEPGEEIVGQKIRIENVPFQIIGIFAPKGSDLRGRDQDDVAYMPYTTFSRKLRGSRLPGVVHVICLSAQSKDLVSEAKREVEEILRRTHHIRPGAPDEFSVHTVVEFAQMADKTMGTLTILLTCVAAVSLLVGGIGIMNIMLVSVTERTREIGVRMAVGARERDVLVQFLAEAITMSVVGGIFGTILGISVSKMIGSLSGWLVPINIDAILLATFFAAAVGVFFGFYPARKASRMHPIEALRYE